MPLAGEEWDGCYPGLFPWRERDNTPECVVDVHTNHGGRELHPPSVLHVAPGPIALTLSIIARQAEATLYVR